ncbi:MAG: hypothetical protein Q9187_005224 [Circinaria calcarea]
MPFPFLDLPAELRTEVYRYLLHSKGRIEIDPLDAIYTIGASEGRPIRVFADSIPFLRTCVQIHREGTAMLYGSNVFYFEDEPYCTNCGCVQAIAIAYLHIWLQLIGKNRTKITQIHIFIEDPLSLYYPGEIGLELYNLNTENEGRGSYLGNAFAIFSHGHNLQKLEMRFSLAYFRLSDHLLGFGMNSLLIQQMAKVSGVKKVIIKPLPKTCIGVETLAKLKARMEGKGSNAKVDAFQGTKAGGREKTDPAEISADCDKLRECLDRLTNGVQEVKEIMMDLERKMAA